MVPVKILAFIYAGAVCTCLVMGGKIRSMSKVNWDWPKHYRSVKIMLPIRPHHHHHPNDVLDNPSDTGVVKYYGKRSNPEMDPVHRVYDTLSASVSLGHHHHPISTSSLLRPSRENQACLCTTRPTQVDLGSLRFPRYLTSVECSAGPCSLPGQNCEGRSIKIWVLKQREDGDIEDRHAPFPPRPLRESYIFEGRVITVACGCSA